MKVTKKLQRAIDLSKKEKKDFCSNCYKSKGKRGNFSNCCDAVIVDHSDIAMILQGQIPNLPFSDIVKTKDDKSVHNKPKKHKKDLKTGIRKGTKKYEVYRKWKAGKTVQQTVKELDVKAGSVRSWYSSFNQRYNSEK